MTSKQTLSITILSCGGMFDQMSESEASFLNNSLGLFRNVKDFGRATPRARASVVRAYRPVEALSALRSIQADVMHLIAHGIPVGDPRGPGIQVGRGRLYASQLSRKDRKLGALRLPPVLVSTVCSFDQDSWMEVLGPLGVKVVIASRHEVTPANLATFDMAFYSALLAQVYRGKSTLERVEAAFNLANAHYEAVHAIGSPHANFALRRI